MSACCAPCGQLGFGKQLGGEAANGPKIMVEIGKYGVRQQRIPHGPAVRVRGRFNGFEKLAKLSLVRSHKQQVENWFAPSRAARMRGDEGNFLCRLTLYYVARCQIFLKRKVQETDISLSLIDQ